MVANVASSSAQSATTSAASVGGDATAIAAATETAAETAATETITVETPEGTETVVEEVVVDVEVEAPENPSDNITPVNFTTFTLALSYGNFTVTIRSDNNDVIVLNSGTTTIGQVFSSADGTVNEFDLSGITVELADGSQRPLTGVQLANLDTNLTIAATAANNGNVVVEVPSDTITVSPSS